MRKHSIFCPNGWDRLEVRITPSTVGHVPAEIVRIDAHVQHARRPITTLITTGTT